MSAWRRPRLDVRSAPPMSGAPAAELPPPAPAERSEGGVLRPGETVWRVATAHRAAVLVDAAPYYGALRKALRKARHSITIVGWDVDSRTPLVDETGRPDDDLPITLAEFLTELVSRNKDLRVRILLWDYSLFYAVEREFILAIGLQWATPRRIDVCLDDDLPLGSSHHQKLVVIDDEIAFAGGIDLTIRRWDGPDHRPDNPLRVDPGGYPYKPFHDVQAVVDGDAARVIADLARARWRASALEDLPVTPPTGIDYWPEGLTPDFTGVGIGVARTMPPYAGSEPVTEVERLFMEMIDVAERSIYIENQFLTAASIARRLAARLADNPLLEVVLVCPQTHHTWIEHRTMLAGRIRFKAILDASGCGERVRLVYPSVGEGSHATPVMIHSKVMIVDDRLLRVGSANLCNRSFGADSECDIVIDAGSPEERKAVASVRDRLLAEHCGADAGEIAAVMRETGSLIAAIDRCSTSGRGLLPIDDGELGRDDPPAGIEMIADPPRPILPADLLADFDGGLTEPRNLRKYLLAGAMVLAVVALVFAWRYTPLALMTDPERIAEYLTRFESYAWGLPLTVGIFVLAGLVAFPVTVLIGGTAVAFGLWPGILYSACGAMASALVTYALGRWMGSGPLRRIMGPRMNRVRKTVTDHGIIAVATIRLMPVAPFTFVNLVAGATKVRVLDYTIGTALGLAPGIAVMSSLGESILHAVRDPSPAGIAQIVLIVTGWIALSFGFHVLVTRMRKRRG